MRPSCRESRSSCFGDSSARWILDLGWIRAALLNIHHDRPATVRRMLQVLCNRIVLFFPTIQASATEKAYCIIRISFVGFVVEARMRQLRRNRQRDRESTSIEIPLPEMVCYVAMI